MTSRSEPYIIDEIEALLLAQEKRIENLKKDSSVTMTSNMAQKSTKIHSGSSQGNSQVGGNFQGGGQSDNTRGRGNFARGGGRSFRGGRNRPQCQVCGKFEHMAWNCFHIYEQTY